MEAIKTLEVSFDKSVHLLAIQSVRTLTLVGALKLIIRARTGEIWSTCYFSPR